MAPISKKRTSALWNYFEQLDEKYAKCGICKANLSFGTSISNLRKHLIIKHPSFSKTVEKSLEPEEPTTEEFTTVENMETFTSEKSNDLEINTVYTVYEEPVPPVNTKHEINPIALPKPSNNNNFKKHLFEKSLPFHRNATGVSESFDEFDAIGTAVSFKLRRMDEVQRNISEYLIHQILFHGLSNRLNEEVSINFPKRSQSEMHSQAIFVRPLSDPDSNNH